MVALVRMSLMNKHDLQEKFWEEIRAEISSGPCSMWKQEKQRCIRLNYDRIDCLDVKCLVVYKTCLAFQMRIATRRGTFLAWIMLLLMLRSPTPMMIASSVSFFILFECGVDVRACGLMWSRGGEWEFLVEGCRRSLSKLQPESLASKLEQLYLCFLKVFKSLIQIRVSNDLENQGILMIKLVNLEKLKIDVKTKKTDFDT